MKAKGPVRTDSKLRVRLNESPQPSDVLLRLPLHPTDEFLTRRDVVDKTDRDSSRPDSGVGISGGVDD